MEDFTATALGLVERTGRAGIRTAGFDPRDMSVGAGDVGARGVPARLRELADSAAGSVPR